MIWKQIQQAVSAVPYRLEHRLRRDGAERWVWEQGRSLSPTGEHPAMAEGVKVTEGFAMYGTDVAAAQLEDLRQFGIEIAIDDFGTGYSSLRYIRELPIDKLKIDQSFVRDIPVDENAKAIATAVIALGKALRFKVIAEGVETGAQAEFLAQKGCAEGQGYLFSKPLTADEMTSVLTEK